MSPKNSASIAAAKPIIKNISRNSVSVAVATSKPITNINTNRNSVPVSKIITKNNIKTKSVNGSSSGSNSNILSSPSNSIKASSVKSNTTNSSQESGKGKTAVKAKSSMNALSSMMPKDFVSPLTPYSYTPYTPYVTPYLVENSQYKDDIAPPQFDEASVIIPPCVESTTTVATVNASSAVPKGSRNIRRMYAAKSKSESNDNENKNDSILREINRNGSRTISKRTSVVTGHENSTSLSKSKRRSIFTRIF